MHFFYALVLTLVYCKPQRIKPSIDVDDTTKFPYVVAIASQNEFTCGGVIIDEFWILTAYHCVEELPIEDYYVEAGTFDVSAMDGSPPSADRNVYYIESMHDRAAVDLALLKLKTPLTFTDSVGKIFLANKQDPLEEGQSFVMAGWGGGSTILRYNVTNHTCRCHTDEGEWYIFTANTTDYSIGELGDAGGPLMKEVHGTELLYGIIINNTCPSDLDVSVDQHARVSDYRTWIEEITHLTLENTADETYVHDPESKTCKGKPGNGGGYGEPHFRMWNSAEWFDYHGECDLVLVDNPALSSGSSLKIHVRTKIQSWYSFIFQAAISIDDQVLEMKRNKQFWLNGKSLDEPPANFSGYPMESLSDSIWCHAKHCEGAVIQKLDLGSDGHIVFTIWKGFIYVHVSADSGFWDSVGILGRRDKPGMFARNGSQLFETQAYAEDWQVRNYEKIFMEDRYPQHPNPCIPPPSVHVSRRMGHDTPLRRMAGDACSVISEDGPRQACIFDVWATGDFDLVSPYQHMEKYTLF